MALFSIQLNPPILGAGVGFSIGGIAIIERSLQSLDLVLLGFDLPAEHLVRAVKASASVAHLPDWEVISFIFEPSARISRLISVMVLELVLTLQADFQAKSCIRHSACKVV